MKTQKEIQTSTLRQIDQYGKTPDWLTDEQLDILADHAYTSVYHSGCGSEDDAMMIDLVEDRILECIDLIKKLKYHLPYWEKCPYCNGDCPNEPDDSPNLCDGFAGDVDNLCDEQNSCPGAFSLTLTLTTDD